MTDKNAQNGEVCEEVSGEEAPECCPNGDARPNGHAEPAGEIDPAEMEDLDEAIVSYARQNPQKSAEAVAKHFGQPKAVVADLLAGVQ